MRWDLVDSRTGFLALGPYIKTDCGVDTTGNGDFPRMRDIYSMFREEVSSSLSAASDGGSLVLLANSHRSQFCPPTLQLSAWAGQFIVSRQRILANSRSKYETLLNSLQAPMHHWIHEEGAYFEYKGSVGPSNPFLGHALERSWPTIFSESRSIITPADSEEPFSLSSLSLIPDRLSSRLSPLHLDRLHRSSHCRSLQGRCL